MTNADFFKSNMNTVLEIFKNNTIEKTIDRINLEDSKIFIATVNNTLNKKKEDIKRHFERRLKYYMEEGYFDESFDKDTADLNYIKISDKHYLNIV